tara:strand:- start:1601 stop:2491 length:891 start_codon:yes stop_codon:yes gene_type:complete
MEDRKGPEYLGRFLGAIVALLIYLMVTGCSTYRLATVSDDMYPVDFTIPVSNETKIDTINSYFQLRYKLRTDFNFRWDFAQYAMNQPYSWYWNNPRLDGIWRPYNRFDVYFHSHWFWTDWAWNYPFNYHSWGWYDWNRPYYFYGWNRPYRPWNNINWNTNYNNNIVYVSGRRGSRNIISNNNSNIENNIVRRYNNPRKNIDNSNLNNIINELRDNYNIKPRVYSNPNNIPNNNIIRNNNNRPIVPNYNNNIINNNIKPRSNSINRSYSPPPSSNISRGSSSSNGGSSRGGNSRGRN